MTNNFNLPEAPIQNDDGILTFSHKNTEFVVDVDSKESREECSRELNRISGRHYEWCKETGVKKQKERIIGFFTIRLCIAKFTEVMTSTL